MLTVEVVVSMSIITAGLTAATPSTARTWSAMVNDIGAPAKPPVEPELSVTSILSA